MSLLDTTPEAERIQLNVLRQMKPEQRLQIAIDLAHTSRKLLMEGVRMRHPDYSEDQIRLAAIRLILKENLFFFAYPEAKDILP